MPAIRDKSWAFESTTTDAGITIPMCAYAQNDLLVVFAMSDTASGQTWTAPTNYTPLFTRINTSGCACFIKKATASEVDPVVGSNVTETYNGCVISVRDVDPDSPLPSTNIESYSESNQSATAPLGNGTTTGYGQSFASGAPTHQAVLSKARFYLSKTGSPTGNITAKLYAHSGTFGTSSVPTGAALATSNTVSAASLTGSLTLTDFYFPGPWFRPVNSTNYVLTIEYSGGDASNFVNVGYDGTSPTHGGNYSSFASAVWTANSGRDLCFYVQKFNFAEATITSVAKQVMTTTTTDRDNSIVLYMLTSSSVQAPVFCEGPVNHLSGGDGAAESMGVGWGFLKTAGTTASNVFANSYTTGSGSRAVLAVQPPLTGATVVPPYIVTDNCSLLDLLHGTTAYNGNTAFAATADTNFGTSLGGKTANDATVAAIADSGINSFHSLAGATNATTTDQISGAELVFSAGNRPNVGTKNILCHIRQATPLQAQRFTNIASGRGAWFGMRSNTTGTSDHKVWQVHSVDSPWSASAHVPIIINSGAGNVKDNAGTLNTAAITAFGFWHGGITGSNTCQLGYAMLWSMDSTILCGGNSTEPLTIEGITNTIAAPGKERYSAVLQGANQMLLLQDLQIGDGGTNPTYLNLDSTAIEFPAQYNTGTKKINYNSTDNVIGLLYQPGASDTIIHKDSIISSPSRYKWGLHASASASATYNFSGLAVIGAGTVTLNKAITITGLTLNNYSTLNVTDADLVDCVILNVPATNDSVTSNANTSFSSCAIDVSDVTSGNRWLSVADPSVFSGCAFTGGGGHAIRITTPGTYSFSGNTFTGFGVDGSNGAAIFNDSGGLVTINLSGGVNAPTVRNGAGASTTINNSVTLTVTVTNESAAAVSGARVRISKQSDNSLVADGSTNGSGVFSSSFNYTSSVPVNVTVRLKRYIPFDTTGTITSNGLTVGVRFIKDLIVD